MNETFLCTANDLAIGYGKTPLLSGIALGVQPGQILTLIGPNGAGKSTLLRTLAGQLDPMGGAVLLDEKNLSDYTGTQRAQKLALMAPHSRRMELTTCFDFAAAARYPYTGWLGIPGKEDVEKVDEALALVSGEELKERDFAAISDGQRQKILLARAICQEPELIILDEPTSYLDVKHKLEFLTVLRKLVRERNMAVVMSLHELDLAQKISDRVMTVCEGRVDRIGTPEDIFTDEYINRLYNVTEGSYHEAFGAMELPAAKAAPQVFVIGGGGSGLAVYRKLARLGIPFATGVLHEHDIDYEAAKYSAAQVIVEEAFEPIREETRKKALLCMEQCPEVICCLTHFGIVEEIHLHVGIDLW